MFKHYPILYKKTSKGAIQQWKIDVKDNKITTTYGQVGGKMQVTVDVINFGKNIGKRNETTPEEQAISEADSKWQKKKDQGFTETIISAENEEHNLDGIDPMLAHKFSEHGEKIKFPCISQRKYDGIRLLGIVKDGKCTLWSRKRKPITSLPHIVEELERIFANSDVIIDGEAYSHKFHNNFEHIVHIVKQQKKVDPNHKDVEYHVYDVVSQEGYQDRYNFLLKINEYSPLFIKVVESYIVNNEEEMMSRFNQFRADGYEGLMLRNLNTPYEHKRSYSLQKVKEFDTEEFIIVDVKEGRGKLAGHAIFICETKDKNTFDVKLKGDTDKLKEYFEHPELVIGKPLTVQFQGYTNKENVPRFPVGITLRDYE